MSKVTIRQAPSILGLQFVSIVCGNRAIGISCGEDKPENLAVSAATFSHGPGTPEVESVAIEFVGFDDFFASLQNLVAEKVEKNKEQQGDV